MSKFNEHHEGVPRCTGCDRVGIVVQTAAERRYCLPCLRKKQPDTYARLYIWATEHRPEPDGRDVRIDGTPSVIASGLAKQSHRRGQP